MGEVLNRSTASASEYRFGGFRLLVEKRELHRDDVLLVLAPKLIECLTWLIEHRDRAVGRDELIAVIWDQADVPVNLLAQIISRLRRLLDEDADPASSLIRTIPRFGYRWVAPTEVLDVARHEGQHHEIASTTPGNTKMPCALEKGSLRGRRVTLALVLGAICIAAVAGLSVVNGFRSGNRSVRVPPAPEDVVMLLPTTVGAGAEHAWMRLGLMSLLGDRLREAGQPTLPSDNAVALAAGFTERSSGRIDIEGLLAQAPSGRLIASEVRRVEGRWRVTLHTFGNRSPVLQSSAEADDALDAARLSADRMLQLLGREPVAAVAAGERQMAQVLIEVEAATLAGDIGGAMRLIDMATDAQRRSPDLRYRRGWVAFEAGQFDIAQNEYLSLLAELPATSTILRARVLNGLANVEYERGDIAGLRRSSDDAIALLADARNGDGELGRALMGRAVAKARSNDRDGAQRDFAEARVVLESVGDRLGMARAELAAGILEKQRGRLFEALPLLERGASELAVFRDVHDELVARLHMAHAHLLLLEPAAALAIEPRLAALIGQASSPRAIALAQVTRIEVLTANGRLSAAQALLDAACGLPPGTESCAAWPLQLALARLTLDATALPDMRHAIDEALSQLRNDDLGRDPARAGLILLRDHLAHGRNEAATALLLAMNAWSERLEMPETLLYSTLAQAEQLAASGQRAEARRAFEDASRSAEMQRVPTDMLWVAEAYADWLLGEADLATAAVVGSRAAAWANADFDAALLQLRVRHALGQRGAWSAALDRARALAGERMIPLALTIAPGQSDDPGTLAERLPKIAVFPK